MLFSLPRYILTLFLLVIIVDKDNFMCCTQKFSHKKKFNQAKKCLFKKGLQDVTTLTNNIPIIRFVALVWFDIEYNLSTSRGVLERK